MPHKKGNCINAIPFFIYSVHDYCNSKTIIFYND